MNNLLIHSENIALLASLVSNTATVGNNIVDNVANPLLDSIAEFNSNTQVQLIYNLSNVDAGLREIRDVIFYIHNIAANGTIRISTSNDVGFGSLVFDATKTIPADKNLDYDFLESYTGYPSGLYETNGSVNKLYYPLGQDISASTYIRFIITVTGPVNPDNIKLAYLYFGWNQQFSINIVDSLEQGFNDFSLQESYNNDYIFTHKKGQSDTFKFEFMYEPYLDARIARYVPYYFGNGSKFCLISIEPENTDDWDEYRQHMMTLGGHLTIKPITEFGKYKDSRFTGEFKTAVYTMENSGFETEGISGIVPVGARRAKIKLWAKDYDSNPNANVGPCYDNVIFKVGETGQALGSNLLENPSFEANGSAQSGHPNFTFGGGWTLLADVGGTHEDSVNLQVGGPLVAQDLTYFYYHSHGSGHTFTYQRVDLAAYAALIDAGLLSYSISFYYANADDGSFSHANKCQGQVEFYTDWGDVGLLGTFDTGEFAESYGVWSLF